MTKVSCPTQASTSKARRGRPPSMPKVSLQSQSIASTSSSKTKRTQSALFQALQRVKQPDRSITTLSELKEYVDTKSRPTVELRVAHVTEPAVKKTTESIVHVFLCAVTHQETKEEMKEFGLQFSDALKSGQRLSIEFNQLLVRATVWQTKIEALNFEVGDLIRIAHVSKISAFRGLLQFNCSPENIQKLK